ncbi:putative isomerase YbhE protein [Dioscorea alata]|uniref:Isomerase YbhE protein n=3 Tax=Dioscorea alata TaxID=55571 RepID=A0ACB7WJT1_DIOAL|nr:putative isomerase YbhE protein [Dioscorea alata]KAH7688212.1 putative isomerase YbhE protein [Dioscorea alata]KAH7688213.1 putative isomerase YbhE protein [Dioscorea alata]
MGGSQSREGLSLSDSEPESESDEYQETEEEEKQQSDLHLRGSASKTRTPISVAEVDAKLQSLKLKYSPKSPNPSLGSNSPNAAKLYLHIGGSLPSAKWIISEKLTFFSFSKPDYSDDDDSPSSSASVSAWVLTVGTKIKARVGPELQLKPFPAQRRVDFVADGVWALKFFSVGSYHGFLSEYQKCLFENTYNLEANDANKVRVFGNDFLGWAKPEVADDAIWEDAEESFEKSPRATVARGHDLLEEFEEEAGNDGGIQSLALGALENSFLVSDSGVQVLKNFSHGVHGKGVSVKLSSGNKGVQYETPKKAVLMRGETNMLLMSPATAGKPHSTGVRQLDIETGKVVTEWKFEKDGTDITMRDITNDSKGAQLDPSESTFLGLDDNRLCRWDMRDRGGIVQNLANSMESPVLQWTQGHQFSRGTNFQCFASTGDGSIVVGSLDGKIRLYSKSSMRMAKTAFPGLGSPITHVDVTYDGRWILGTTDTYLILISTIFKDKDGKEKTGFTGRMGNRIAAPRLLKLTPLDAHLAGKNKIQKGQFSWVTENGKQERHLVATVGKFSIIWNFQQVKNSHHECYLNHEGLKSCYCYKIVPKEESIVDSRFMHEKFATSDSPEAPLVVVTPMKVSSFSISNRR